MINFSKHSLYLKREQLIRSIKQQQIQQIKSKQRYKFECTVINPVAEVWRLKDALAQYNIHYYPKEILQIMNCIIPYLHDQPFLRQLKSSRLIEDLFRLIIGQLKMKPYLQASLLTEVLTYISSELLRNTQSFNDFLKDYLSYLYFAVYKYPLNNKIVEKVTNCISILQPKFTTESRSSFFGPLIQLKSLIQRLLQIYLVRQNYETSSGLLQFSQFIEKGDERWINNAVNILQITDTLLFPINQKQSVFKLQTVKLGLIEALKVYLKKKKKLHPKIQEQYSDSQTFIESNFYNSFMESPSQNYQRDLDQRISYFICIVLDIFLLREQLIDKQQQYLLREILQILLNQTSKKHNNKISCAKIIKILYQQVILDQNDLYEISNRYEQLSDFIHNIISSDCI